MALKPMNPGAVSTATVVSDLPDMPQDLADRTAVAKWWFDTRLVFQRLLSDIERRRNVGGTEPATEYSPTWDSITGKPDKFPPEDHSHAAGKATPLVQVVAEDPLVAGTTDPNTGNADIGFHEQTAATFLAGPVIGPPQLPVFRPILLSDLPASVRDMPTGGNPGTYDDLNGGTGGGTPEGSIAVQARGGSWSYCGYVPYDGVEDSPPLRYRTETPSGTVVRKDYDWLHTTLLATRTDTPIGPRTWVGCTEPTASLWQRVQTAGGACEAGTSGIDEPPSTAAAVEVGHLVRSCTNTCGAIGNGNGCCGNALGNCGVEFCGNAARTLSNPDTPDAAIARLKATSPEWGSSPNTAIRTVAATGITGLYREARYRTEHTAGAPAVTYPTLIGLVPWQRYQLTVTLESRPVDSAGAPTGDGTWSAAGTRQHYFVADLTGEGGIDWQTVEPTAGYETRIASTLVEVA